MQEGPSTSPHEVSQLYRTKQHEPSAPPVSEGGPSLCGGLFKNFPSQGGRPTEHEQRLHGFAMPPCPGAALPAPSPTPDQPPSPSPSQNRAAPLTFVANKYVLLDKVEGSSLYNCVDVHTREQLVCKVVGREAGNLLAAHFRVDGHPHLNSLREVLLGPVPTQPLQPQAPPQPPATSQPGSRHMYLIFPASHGDLHTYVRTRKRLRESEARRLFRQMAECVRHCHEAGIVLRDLKLRKFVFTDPQRTTLKLESLEDAVVLDSPDDDLLQDKRGCPAYVSPEILRSHAQYSGRAADMWSLGVILYTTLVGRYPFNDTEHASLFAKISRGHYVMPECLSHSARCLIRSLLLRDPAERLTAQDVLSHPWLRHPGPGRDERDERDLDRERERDSASADQLVPDVM